MRFNVVCLCLHVTLAAFIPATVDAQPLSITSVDNVWIVGGRLYIGFNTQVERDEVINSRLKELWDSKGKIDFIDEIGQDTKVFDIAVLEEIFGKVQSEYLILQAEFGKIDREAMQWCVGRYPDFCTEPLVGLVFSRRKSERALIFDWGCVSRLIPVLDLGEIQVENAYNPPELLALGSSIPLPIPALGERYPQAKLPAEVLEYFQYQLNYGIDGFTLQFNQETRYGLEHGVGRTQGHDLWILENLNPANKKIQVRQPGSVTDSC